MIDLIQIPFLGKLFSYLAKPYKMAFSLNLNLPELERRKTPHLLDEIYLHIKNNTDYELPTNIEYTLIIKNIPQKTEKTDKVFGAGSTSDMSVGFISKLNNEYRLTTPDYSNNQYPLKFHIKVYTEAFRFRTEKYNHCTDSLWAYVPKEFTFIRIK